MAEKQAAKPNALRRQAESFIKGELGSEKLAELNNADMNRLMHELRVHQIELEMQNEALRQSQNDLEQVRDRLYQLFHHAPVGYIILDRLGFILQSNHTFANLIDRNIDDVLKKPFVNFLIGESKNEFLARFKAFFKSPEGKQIEVCLMRLNGSALHAGLAVVQSPPIFTDASSQPGDQLWLTISDISDRVAAENKIRKSLREKETLLQEVHHRVKNNMQIISSLLNLQARKSGSEQITEALNKGRSRVFAMSIAHEILYSSENLAEIDLELYIRRLVQSLFQTFLVDPAQIRFHVESARIMIDIKQATSIGLIVNELVSNAMKYAFPDGRGGEISIRIDAIGDREIRLVIADNGIGLPGKTWLPSNGTLGLQLVNSLTTDQLNGRISVDCDNGTCYTLYLCPSV
jgi:PAS domain S-box-containing protein